MDSNLRKAFRLLTSNLNHVPLTFGTNPEAMIEGSWALSLTWQLLLHLAYREGRKWDISFETKVRP